MLADFDAAIHDGVDVISVSVGSSAPDFFTNSVAIGSFHAMQRVIPVVCAAGNIGPPPYSVCNLSQWILTVAGVSDGRAFTSHVTFGNGEHVEVSGLVCLLHSASDLPLGPPFGGLFFEIFSGCSYHPAM